MELVGRSDLNVRRIAWAPMQARVLEFDWIVPADHILGAPWSDYPLVTYTDESGVRFVGTAIEPARQFKAGETIRVTCADVWRKWERKTARLSCPATTPAYADPGTSKIRIREGVTIESAINTILAAVTADIPGGIDFTLPEVTDPPNPDAPTTVVDRGEFNRFHTYAVHDVVTYLNIKYIAIVQHLALENTPDQNFGWELYYAQDPLPHPPVIYTTQDKTGQKIATWLHDIIDQSDNGIALIDYIDGHPRLNVYDYTSKPAVTLKMGTYTIVNPDAVNPLILNGEVKLSQNNKYEKIIVEGGGIYTRHVGAALTPVSCGSELRPGDNLVFMYRFYFPESNVLGAYIDPANKQGNAIFYRFGITAHPSGAETTFDTGYLTLSVLLKDYDEFLSDGSTNPHFLHYYAPFEFDTTPDDTAGPTFTLVEFRYTSYDGPLTVTKASSDASLAGAGDFPIHMPKWYKFTSPGFKKIIRTTTSIDPGTGDTVITTATLWVDGSYTPITGDVVTWLESITARDYSIPMMMIANAYYSRYCNTADNAGALTVVIKGDTAEIDIGTAITNFNNARVQSMEVTPDKQSLKITISDQPIREYVYRQRDYYALAQRSIRQLSQQGLYRRRHSAIA